MIHQSITELIGSTPLLELSRLEEAYSLKAVSYTHLDVYKRQLPGRAPT